MDIETLEVFEVINLDEKDKSEASNEMTSGENKVGPYDDMGRICLGNGHYYKTSSLLWEVIDKDTIHDLSPRNKHGTYPYYQHTRDGTWG